MATGAQVVLVAATPTLLAANGNHDDDMTVIVSNTSGAALFLGGPTVGTTGYSMASAAILTVTLVQGDQLWGYSTAGGTVNVLTSP